MNKGFNDSKDLPRSPLDWNYVDKMRQDWKGKFGIKGILTREDAALSIRHGMDFIHVSNHGGRAAETSLSTIQILPEIVDEVKGRVPVFIDGGFHSPDKVGHPDYSPWISHEGESIRFTKVVQGTAERPHSSRSEILSPARQRL